MYYFIIALLSWSAFGAFYNIISEAAKEKIASSAIGIILFIMYIVAIAWVWKQIP